LAEQIGEKEIVSLLKKSLSEEQGAEDKLRKIARNLLSGVPRKVAA
jgi:ferritin-like metal-binding protein YciE